MARPALVIDNYNMKQFILNMVGDTIDMSELPNWVEDMLYSASRSGFSNPSSPYALTVALATLDELSFDNVESFLTRKTQAITGKSYSRTHIATFFTRLKTARNMLIFHYERRNKEKFPVFHRPQVLESSDFLYADGFLRSEILHRNVVRN